MKGIFKFMTVALAAGLVVSCSDDLGLDQAGKYAVGQQEGVGTIVAFDSDLATRLAAKDNFGVGRPATEGFVWKKGEEVRVFSLNQLAQDIFVVDKGDGTSTATFTQKVNAELTGQKYAVTESQMVYGISAEPNADGNGKTLPLLTLTLPSGRDILDSNGNGNDFDIINAWTPGDVDGVKGLRNFPIPFWGAAEVTGAIDEGYYKDAKLTTTVQSLTAAIRINLKSLPKDTKYIVLTTHGGGVFRPEEGFILADKISGPKDEKSTWYDASENPKNPDWWITGGWGEPIAGTLRAVLNPEYTYVSGADKSEWPKLEVDPRLVQSDELIVDISKLAENDRIIYLPVVCGTYKNLHVIAAKTISEKFRYCYVGTELKNFQDQEFEVNKLYNLDMGLVVAEKAHLDELNDLIKANCKDMDITTVINVGTFYAYNLSDLRNDTAIYVNVPGNVQLNLEKIVTCTRGKNFKFPLTVTDEIKAAHSVRESLDRVREVEINVPNTWFLYGGEEVIYNNHVAVDKESSDYLRAAKLNVVCGKSDVILGSVDGNKNSLVAVNVLASNTQFAKHNTQELTYDGPIYPETQAAIWIKHGFGRVNVVHTEDGVAQRNSIGQYVAGTKGDIYIFTPANTEFETEIDTLDIEGRIGNYIRLDNSLVYHMHFSEFEATAARTVYNTGSSAIGYIYDSNKEVGLASGANKEHYDNVPEGFWTPYTPIDSDVPVERNKWYVKDTYVGGVGVRSYWTGSALSVRAINAKAGNYSELTYESPLTAVYPERSYDVRTIWTAAQLASVGEGVYSSSLKKSNHEFDDDLSLEVQPKVAVYNIPKDVVKTMWLGSHIYPWIGARARINGFKLNGEGTELKNMNMLKKWYDNDESFIVDPHWCCTTCWKNGINPGAYINIKEDVGLIRYIQNGDEVTVFNVHVNDPELDLTVEDDYCEAHPDWEINNVGTIVGRISTKKANVYNNMVGEVKIRIPKGNNIGGMVGLLQLGWEPIEGVNNFCAGKSWYTTSEKVINGPLYMAGNEVWGNPNPSGFIQGYEYVGGLCGKIEKPTTAEITDNKVNLKGDENLKINIESFYGHTGGLAGYLITAQDTKINSNIVDCAKNIEANGGNFAGRYEGSYVGGLIGQLINKGTGTLELHKNLVRAKSILAGKAWVGGLVGDLEWIRDLELGVESGIVSVDDDFVNYNANASVKADKYMVVVADSIMCKANYAGGLFGQSTLTQKGYNTEFIKAAQVKAGLIEATGSWAGGLIGQIYRGDTRVGDDFFEDTDRDRGVIVEVGQIASGRGAGGLFGANDYEGLTEIRIFDGKGPWYSGKNRNYKTYTFIEVKDWKRTSTPEQPQYYGTFSNVLGFMSDVLFINNDMSTEEANETASMFWVIDHLDAAKKKAVGYQLHTDQNHNEVDRQYYWGDNNGYVGWRITSDFFIGGTDYENTVVMEQLESYNLPTANIFLQASEYGKDSKLPKTGSLNDFLK